MFVPHIFSVLRFLPSCGSSVHKASELSSKQSASCLQKAHCILHHFAYLAFTNIVLISTTEAAVTKASASKEMQPLTRQPLPNCKSTKQKTSQRFGGQLATSATLFKIRNLVLSFTFALPKMAYQFDRAYVEKYHKMNGGKQATFTLLQFWMLEICK